MSPRITIYNGERIIAELEVRDMETFGLAGDALADKSSRLTRASRRSGIPPTPEGLQRVQELGALAETLYKVHSDKTV